jgi:transposase
MGLWKRRSRRRTNFHLKSGLSGKVKTAWLWAYARDDTPFGGSDPPLAAYKFEDSRSDDCVVRHLAGYRDILQVDGYAADNRLARVDGAHDGVILAGCWCHARRKFFDLPVNESSRLATHIVEAMAPLWQIEAEIRGHDPDHRRRVRQKHSSVIVRELFASRDRELPRLSGKSRLAEAIRYALGRRVALKRFLADGRIEIGSNIVERII